jgi:hypothetical protein
VVFFKKKSPAMTQEVYTGQKSGIFLKKKSPAMTQEVYTLVEA